MKVIIIGGVAGGASAAARLRRMDEGAQIVLFERSGFISYANCGLPYYVGGVIEKEDALTLQTPEGFSRRFAVDVRVRSEVLAIDREKKTVLVRGPQGERYEEGYDKLLLAPGAKPIVPPMPGVDGPRIFRLRTVEDALAIRGFVARERPTSVLVAGGGFVGVEMAENLRTAGLGVTLVQRGDHLLGPFDPEMATLLHQQLRAHGVRLMLGTQVLGFAQEGQGVRTVLSGGGSLASDFVVLCIGVAPESDLARAAGLALGERGAIRVNARMQTSDPDIYAVGDAVQIPNRVSLADAHIPLAGPANKQGRIAADAIAGRAVRYPGALGTCVVKLFDLTAAATGLSDRAARASGLDIEKIILTPANHASYYPGARAMTMKVLCERGSMRLLGAQIVGGEGVDKRIDVLATATAAGLCGPDLATLDLAYAPPYGSAKDPINMAGYILENVAQGIVRHVFAEQIDGLPRDGSVSLIDVRTPREYARGHAEGFVNVPLDDLRARLEEIPADRPAYLMCQSGIRSYLASRILAQRGVACYNLAGGYGFYRNTILREREEAATSACGAIE